MKKLLVTVLLAISLLTSCSSVYVTPNSYDTTASVIVDLEKEYFTDGAIWQNNISLPQDGCYYQGDWYYPEIQKYYSKAVDPTDDFGIETAVSINRIVKYNPRIQTVSPACLSPSCLHSLDSDCPLLCVEDDNSKMWIERIVGDWMLITKYQGDTFKGDLYQMIAYNLKTGKLSEIYNETVDGMIKIGWAGGTPMGNKLYMTKNILDYSDSGYDGDMPLVMYEPQTKSFAYEYDLDTQTSKELFELPDGCIVRAFSNKRLLLVSEDGNYYTCNFDGSNIQEENVLDFAPKNMIGTLAYNYIDNGFELYNLETNSKKTILIDKFTLYQNCIITNSGIFYNTFTTIDNWAEMVKNTSEYVKEHGPSSLANYIAQCNQIKHSGTAQLWKSDHNGNNIELIFEADKSVIRYLFGDDKYIFCYITDMSNTVETTAKCAIDISTGKISYIPMLDASVSDN